MYLNSLSIPGQIPLLGVIIIVAATGAVPVFITVKAGMLPVPLAARPMDGLLFVHVKEVPGNVPVNDTADVIAPWHKIWSGGGITSGVGFTVMVKVCAVPTQVR